MWPSCTRTKNQAWSVGEAMSDIKQAALWMRAGKKVRLPSCDKGSYFFEINDFIRYWSGSLERILEDAMETKDLLSDEWELVGGHAPEKVSE